MESFELKKEKYIERISEYVLVNGISDSSLKKMAEAALTSDRMLMHYFKDKSEIMVHVLNTLNRQLICLLGGNSQLRMEFSDCLHYINQALKEPSFGPYLNLWFEIVHLSSKGEEPYVSIGKEIGETYMEWLKTIYQPKETENYEGMTSLLYALTEGFVFLNKINMNNRITLAIGALDELSAVKKRALLM